MRFYLLAPLLIYCFEKFWYVGAGGGTCRTPCAVRFRPGLQYHRNRSNQSVFRFGHTCHGTLARCHAGMAADDHTAWQRSSRKKRRSWGALVWSGIRSALRTALWHYWFLLWMMQHVEQGPAAPLLWRDFARLRYFQWFWSPVPFPFGSWMQDLLVFKPFDVASRYSCSIYLWHWPLWLFTKAMFPSGVLGIRMDAANHSLLPHVVPPYRGSW